MIILEQQNACWWPSASGWTENVRDIAPGPGAGSSIRALKEKIPRFTADEKMGAFTKGMNIPGVARVTDRAGRGLWIIRPR